MKKEGVNLKEQGGVDGKFRGRKEGRNNVIIISKNVKKESN